MARRIFKAIIFTLFGILLLFIICSISVGLWLKSEKGQTWLHDTITQISSEQSGYDIRFHDFTLDLSKPVTPDNATFLQHALSWVIPSYTGLGELTIADTQGIWLRLESFGITLHPYNLWRDNTLTIDKIKAEKLTVLRTPEPPQLPPKDEEPEESSEGLGDTPDLVVNTFLIEHIALSPELTQLPKGLDTHLDATLHWQGQQQKAALQLNTQNLHGIVDGLNKTKIGLEAAFEIPSQILSVQKLNIRDDNIKADIKNVSVHLEQQTIEGEVNIQHLPLEPFMKGLADTDVAGDLSGDITFNGQMTAPALDAKLQLKNTRFEDNALETIQLITKLTLSDNNTLNMDGQLKAPVLGLQSHIKGQLKNQKHLTLQQADILFPTSRFNGKLKCTLPCTLATGEIRFKSEDISDLGKHFNVDMSGAAELDIQLQTPNKKQSVALELEAQSINTPWAQVQALNATGNISDAYQYIPEVLDVQIQQASVPGANIDSLTLSTQKSTEHPQAFVFNANAQGKAEELFSAQLQGLLTPQKSSTKNKNAAPNFEHIQLTLDKLSAEWGKISVQQGDTPLTFERNKSQMQWSAPTLLINNSALNTEGYIDDKTIRTKSSLDSLALKTLPIDALPSPVAESTLSATIELQGDLTNPTMNMAADLAQVTLLENEAPLSVSANAKLVGGQASVDISSDDARLKNTKIQASLPVGLTLQPFKFELSEQAPLSGQIKLDNIIDPWVKALQVDGHHVKGHVAGDLVLAGTIKQPAINGGLKLDQAQYSNTNLNLKLIDLIADLSFQDSSIQINALSARDIKKGQITGKGSLDYLQEALNYTINIQAKQFSPFEQEHLSATLDGNMLIKGDQQQGKVTGEMNLVPMHIQIPEQFEEGVSELNFVEEESDEDTETTKAAPATYPIILDISLLAEQQVYVRGWGLDTEWGGKLKVQGDASAPSIEGVLALKRGRYEDFNKRFKLEKGDLTFSGPTPPSPFIHLVAMLEEGDYKIRPTFTGSVVKPQIQIKSEPELPEDEALSLLLFGKSATEISPVQAIQLASSLRRLAGQGGGGFDPLAKARQTLNVDDIKISSEGQETTVGVGKYITDNVYLLLERGSKPGTGKATVEVELTPNISVDSTTSENNEQSVGVKLKKDY